jgi:hypothetical protein
VSKWLKHQNDQNVKMTKALEWPKCQDGQSIKSIKVTKMSRWPKCLNSFVFQNVIMLGMKRLSVMLSVIMLSVIMLSDIMLRASLCFRYYNESLNSESHFVFGIILSYIMLGVIMPRVVAPLCHSTYRHSTKISWCVIFLNGASQFRRSSCHNHSPNGKTLLV